MSVALIFDLQTPKLMNKSAGSMTILASPKVNSRFGKLSPLHGRT